jgi:hypothetical protein
MHRQQLKAHQLPRTHTLGRMTRDFDFDFVIVSTKSLPHLHKLCTTLFYGVFCSFLCISVSLIMEHDDSALLPVAYLLESDSAHRQELVAADALLSVGLRDTGSESDDQEPLLGDEKTVYYSQSRIPLSTSMYLSLYFRLNACLPWHRPPRSPARRLTCVIVLMCCLPIV